LWGGLVGLGAAFVENPKETTYYLFLEPIYTDWQAGNYGEAIGGSLFVAVEVVVGAKGVASGAKAATAAIRSTRAAQSAGQTINAAAARVRTGLAKIRTQPGSPQHLTRGRAFEAQQLAEIGAPKNTTVWRPTRAQTESAAFETIVGEPKFTPGGSPVGTILDTAGLEIKGGVSPLGSSYQLRLQTYRSLVLDEPLTIVTTRPVRSTFQAYLERWGVTVESIG